jgi:hypothetical protein
VKSAIAAARHRWRGRCLSQKWVVRSRQMAHAIAWIIGNSCRIFGLSALVSTSGAHHHLGYFPGQCELHFSPLKIFHVSILAANFDHREKLFGLPCQNYVLPPEKPNCLFLTIFRPKLSRFYVDLSIPSMLANFTSCSSCKWNYFLVPRCLECCKSSVTLFVSGSFASFYWKLLVNYVYNGNSMGLKHSAGRL